MTNHGHPKHGCLAAKTLTLMAWQDAGEGERDALACEYCDGIQLSTAIRYRGGWLTGGKGRALTTPRRQLLSGIAGQLGRPHGLVGRGVAIMLNHGEPLVSGGGGAAVGGSARQGGR
jgi:hypothetical protein